MCVDAGFVGLWRRRKRPYFYTNANANTYSHTNTNTNTYSHTNADTYSHTDAQFRHGRISSIQRDSVFGRDHRLGRWRDGCGRETRRDRYWH